MTNEASRMVEFKGETRLNRSRDREVDTRGVRGKLGQCVFRRKGGGTLFHQRLLSRNSRMFLIT